MSSNLVRTTLGVCATALAAAAASATAAASQASPLIAFISDRDGSPALWTMATDGSNQHRISDQTGTIRWTGDGRFILVAGHGSLTRMAADGSGAVALAPAFSPVLSPDGTHATFLTGTECAANGCALVVARTDGSARAVLTVDSTGTASWSPDGRHVVYGVGHGSGTSEIWVADEDGGAPTMALSVPLPITSIAWLANDRIAYVTQGVNSARLSMYDLHKAQPGPLTEEAVGAGAQLERSPDGTQFAVDSAYLDAPVHLSVYDEDGNLTAEVGGYTSIGFDWAPDGAAIAYEGCFRDNPLPTTVGPCVLAVLDLKGGTRTTLLERARPSGVPVWSPDGARLALSAEDAGTGTLHIATVGREGANLFWLTSGDQNDTSPVWQPAVPEPPTPPTPGTDELAPNPGFEGDVAADWRFVVDRGDPQSSRFGPTTEFVHTGSQAVCFHGDAEDSTALVRVLGRPVPVEAGHNYHFSAYLRGFDVHEGRIDVTFWDANGAYIPDSSRSSADYGQTVTGTSGWTQVALDERAPDNAATVRLEIRAYGAGSVCADDVSLRDFG